MNNLYCLNESYVILKGEFGEINWRYLIFSFSKCRNSTENNFSCTSEEEINRVLQGGYFGAFVADSFVFGSVSIFNINIFFRIFIIFNHIL